MTIGRHAVLIGAPSGTSGFPQFSTGSVGGERGSPVARRMSARWLTGVAVHCAYRPGQRCAVGSPNGGLKPLRLCSVLRIIRAVACGSRTAKRRRPRAALRAQRRGGIRLGGRRSTTERLFAGAAVECFTGRRSAASSRSLLGGALWPRTWSRRCDVGRRTWSYALPQICWSLLSGPPVVCRYDKRPSPLGRSAPHPD